MVLYLSRRKKMIIGVAATAFAVGLSFSINETLTNYSWKPVLISYSPKAPSTISKNRPNDTGYNSPVTNAKFDPLKQPEPKKVEKTVPEIQVPKIEEKPLVSKPETKPEITKKPSTVVESTVPISAPRPSTRASSPTFSRSETTPKVNSQNSSTVLSQGQLDAASRAWYTGVGSQISSTRSKIKQYEAEIAELERRINDPASLKLYTYGGKTTPEKVKEGFKAKIWEANNWKKREEDYLKVLEEEKARGPRFTELDRKSIARGMLPTKENHNVWGFANPDDNPVTGKNGTYRKRNENRVLNIPEWAPRSPHGIATQEFEGWTKQDVSTSNEEFKKAIEEITGSSGSGNGAIKVFEYTPNDKNPNKSSKSKITAVSLDANDENAFNKFQEFLAKTNGKIDAVVLKNVGDKNKNQNIDKILRALPEKVQKLTLFLESKNAIKGLRAIENKKLKELELYSNDLAIDENWSINPNAVKNVDYISFDYNNPATFQKQNPNEKIPGSILFDTLRWDSGDNPDKITEGLKVAFGSKIYQRPFQGRQGGKGGYPPNLDFSDTDIKTIKQIKFDEIDNIFNENVKNWKEDKYAADDYEGFKVLKFTNLYFSVDKNGSGGTTSNSHTFTVSADDFDKSNYSKRLSGIEPEIKPPERDLRPKPYIYFRSGGQNQQNVTLKLTGSSLTEDAKKQLKVFIEAVGRGYPFAKIEVETEEIKKQISSYYNKTIEVKTSTSSS
ncbi:putative immunoglobulin-blocking virulence protein [Mesomycoplasma dispar]|uniref:Immunoglobulin-blocking virulence protein n=1 Tax=Mesomycoplasma dispar TaxID=86660 RepID=A0ABN5DUN5_9BACT|nr:putative immunoglobulin-blocking virulence protein [Mesomycoplasma dispar]ATP59742.1 hypothetical protein CSW10_02225 [Mesomycoplasma dispar]